MEPWVHILNCVKYTGEDNFVITADQLKACAKSWTGPANQFEPRLLAYQTSSDSRPNIFKEKGICIFPIKNGTYILTKNNIYTSLKYDEKEPILIKKDTSSVMLNIGDSETSLIDNLRYSGVFDEILGEKITHGPLLNGRHRISVDMKLGDSDICVKGVQYETDSCFESPGKILIVEGKSGKKQIDSFNTRQLYFPYREALKASKGKKEIICVFIHELNGFIRIWKYTFADSNKIDITLTGYFIYKFNS